MIDMLPLIRHVDISIATGEDSEIPAGSKTAASILMRRKNIFAMKNGRKD
eukprot:CAMPEP_0201656404 /NCGR_PEP_ID=MMETSP0493-20130528/46506_1 /ASSEMBLY_ACC=CAM_ASM_000838 /TAXON_ID=420259 /ORGANISM="Thalassiosira gravida, Strain GMp14c1" /LENGTH=49 /DNA_ID=CAMNT_0048133015 /DNA_START=751 /DNA_END=900 /DNA_ORIENTATION=+